MISIEEMQLMLDEITETFPPEIFDKLNGGIILLPETKKNTRVTRGNLLILGEYHSGGNMGRYIAIYYGSFVRIYGHFDNDRFKLELTKTLKHEFTHHMESLAGEKDLEKKDAEFLSGFLRK